MPETDHGVDPRTPPAATRPTRRRVLATGAGAAALLGLGLAGRARAAAAPARLPVAAPAAPDPAGLAPYASYWFPDSLPSGTPAPGSCGARSAGGPRRAIRIWRTTPRPCPWRSASPRSRRTGTRAPARPVSPRWCPSGPRPGTPPRAPRPPTTTRSRTGRTSTSWSSGAAPPARASCSRPTRPWSTPPTATGSGCWAMCSCLPSPTAATSGGPATWCDRTPWAVSRSPTRSSGWPGRTASTAGS